MARLSAYVLLRFAGGVATMLALVAVIVFLTETVELGRTLTGRGDVDFVDLVQLALLKSPLIVVTLLAFIFLFGAMAAFVVLNRRGELIALRAAGVSAWAFIGPSAAAAGIAGAFAVAVLHPLSADLDRAFDMRKAALTGGGGVAASELWLRQGDGRTQIVIHARQHEVSGDAVRLRGVSLFIQEPGWSDRLTPSRRIEAAEARLTPGAWRLSDVREISPGAELEHSEQISIRSTLDRASAMEKFVSPSTVPIWRLARTVRAAKAAGYSAARYEVRLQQLLATPLMLAGTTLLAAAFSVRLTRLGQLPLLCALGVAAGFAVFFVNTLCGALGSAHVLPPLVAAWSPPLLTLCFGAAVLCYTEDG